MPSQHISWTVGDMLALMKLEIDLDVIDQLIGERFFEFNSLENFCASL